MYVHKEWPKWMHHLVHESRMFSGPDDLAGAGDGWRATAFSQEERAEAASNLLCARLEADGPEEVRKKLARGYYDGISNLKGGLNMNPGGAAIGNRRANVEAWLKIQDDKWAQTCKEKEISIAEKAANAAEISAIATRWNVILTAAAVAVSFLSLYFSLKNDAP